MHPRIAAVAGFAWGIGAILFYLGYCKGPDNRYKLGGAVIRLATVTLQVLPILTAVQLLRN